MIIIPAANAVFGDAPGPTPSAFRAHRITAESSTFSINPIIEPVIAAASSTTGWSCFVMCLFLISNFYKCFPLIYVFLPKGL